MPKRGEKLTFQLVYQNSPEHAGQRGVVSGGRASYATMGSAMEQARFAIVSRRIRDPYSHVRVQDTSVSPPTVLMDWAGLDDQLQDLLSIAPEVSNAGYDRAFFGGPERGEE
jgi:hypothetical protein